MSQNESRVSPTLKWGIALATIMLMVLPPRSVFAEDQPAGDLTLEQALEHAFMASPVLEAQEAEVRQAEARVLRARTYLFNPEIEFETGRRSNPAESNTDRGIAILQEIQIGGQRGKRVSVATADLEAAQSVFKRQQRLLAARVQLAFAQSLRTRELLGIAETDVELTRQLLDFAERRVAAGAGTQIGLNLARSTSGLSERELRLAQSDHEMAQNRLAQEIGLASGDRPRPVGDLPFPKDDLPPLKELVALALENRADLIALRKEKEAALQAIRLAKSRAIPNLRLGASYGEEEGIDKIKGVGLSLPIPLFNRNQGGVANAEAEVERLSAEGFAADLAIQREVADAFANYRSDREAAEALQDLVVGTLEGNLTLLQKALEAGKIGAADVLVFRREFVEGQRQFVEALSDAWTAHISLNLAAGRTPVPTTYQQENLP